MTENYNLNKELIKQLSQGEIALEYDKKSLDLLRQILKEDFPTEILESSGEYLYYQKYESLCTWHPNNSTNLPTVKIQDFIEKKKQLPNEFSVYAKTLEEAKYIVQKQKELCKSNYTPFALENHYYRFNPLNEHKHGHSNSSYLTDSILLNLFNIQHEFTCDEFREFFEEEFILPEKWAVLRTKENYKILNNWANSQNNKVLHNSPDGYIHSVDYGINGWTGKFGESCYYAGDNKHPDHTLITFKQFQEHILKQTNTMKEENKKIIGYRLIKPEYETAVLKLVNYNYHKLDTAERGYDLYSEGYLVEKVKKAGVLELWFEPVFENTIKLPIINKYKGEFDGEYITYGCAKFHKEFFQKLYTINNYNKSGNRKIKSIKLDSEVEITMEEVEQIVKYLNK